MITNVNIMADILYYYDGNFEWILYPIFWNIIYNNVCFLGTIPKSPSRCTFRNFIIFANKTFWRPTTHILGGTGDGEWWGREHWPAKPTWWTSPDLQARVALRTWSRWNLIFIFFKQSIIFVSYRVFFRCASISWIQVVIKSVSEWLTVFS